MTITPVELILGEEGAQFWEAVLPAIAERCRDDIHRVGCMFALDHALRANGFDEICNCGIRTFPKELRKHPVRKHFQKFTPSHLSLTRHILKRRLKGRMPWQMMKEFKSK